MLVDVTIGLNGRTVTEEKQKAEKEPDTYWEYDFHQFREKAENINQTAVKENPEKYMGYQPLQEKTLEQRVREQDETIRMLTECLLEMSETVYA